MLISATNASKGMDRAEETALRCPHLSVRPSQLDFVHPPQFVDVLCQLVSNFLQVRWHNNLRGGAEGQLVYLGDGLLTCSRCLYLAGLHRCGDEGGLGEELCSAQQVSHPSHVPLVLFYRLHLHLLLRQQGLITRGVARRRQEFKVAMSAAQQETHPNGGSKVKKPVNESREKQTNAQVKPLSVPVRLEQGRV